MLYLGIDTSNYACSAAIYDSESGEFAANERIDLPVKEGELGLRQSDAVFSHVKLMPQVLSAKAFDVLPKVSAVAVSAAPRGAEGSYMPCFLVGVSIATAVSRTLGVPLYFSNHQAGHILAVVYSTKSDYLFHSDFYGVHLSGGTTDIVACSCGGSEPKISLITSSNDLHAGQCVDRVGKMLGISFPAGKQLSALAEGCLDPIKPKVSVSSGGCSLSGLQNRCERLYADGADKASVARFCLESIAETIYEMLKLSNINGKNVVMSGGVSSSTVIRSYLKQKDINFIFASPKFCCDNAAGISVAAARMAGQA